MSKPPYQPNPSAAKYVSRLIQHNHKESLPPDLPLEWVYITDAIDQVAARGRRARYHAFVEATKDFHFEMVEEVNAFLDSIEDAEEKSRIFYTADDAYTDPPAAEWAVQGLLTRPSLNLLVGPPGTMKTWAALDLAIAVAAGQPWLGRNVAQAPSIFVDEETGLSRLWGRIHAVLHGRTAGHGLPFHYVSFGGYNLRLIEDSDHLLQRTLTFEARLIVVDTLAGVLRGADENSVLSIQPLLYNLRRLAEHCRAAVLLVHHTNRSGSFRGSSAISAGVDLMLSIQAQEDHIHFETLKARHAAPASFAANIHFEQQEDGPLRVHLTAAEEKTQPEKPKVEKPLTLTPTGHQILQRIARIQRSSTEDLLHHVEAAGPTVRQNIQNLADAGFITRVDGGSRGTRAYYELTEKGEEIVQTQAE
ncbi:MAG: AAA family ATPase [Anaerolineales bacterium]|nr:AAA family ATPase [Anaerolineales bacterium]